MDAKLMFWRGEVNENSQIYVLCRTYGGMVEGSSYYVNLLYHGWLTKHNPHKIEVPKPTVIKLDKAHYFFVKDEADDALKDYFDRNIILLITDLGVIFENQKKSWNYIKRVEKHFLCVYVLQLSFDSTVYQLKRSFTFFEEKPSPARADNARKITPEQYEEMISFLFQKKEDGTYPTVKECKKHFLLNSLGGLYNYLKRSKKYTVNTLGQLLEYRK